MVLYDNKKAMSTLGGEEMCGGAQKAKRAGAAVTDLSKSQKVAHIGHDERGTRQGQVV